MLKKILFFLLISNLLFSQEALEKIYKENINGIQFFNPETNDETCFFLLGGNGFVLSFDILDSRYEKLYYSFKHFDRDWNQDNLFESEYMDGYTFASISSYTPSFNTQQNYMHYTLSFPNKDMNLKKSGNYLFTVYNSKRQPLFSKKIVFYENIAQIAVSSERYISSDFPQKNQKINVESRVATSSSLLVQNLSLSIIQNNNWNVGLHRISPQFINGNHFAFRQISNLFEGGNEFISFDTKNIHIDGLGIQRIEKINHSTHTFLYPFPVFPQDYVYNPDVNGAFYFRRFDLTQERDARNEGDYVYIIFFAKCAEALEDLDVYVVGAFNNYMPNKESKMRYNPDTKGYEKSIYLKQGYYNYTLATVNKKTGNYSIGKIPGSFWQTENLYQAFLYYTPFGGNYDAVIGYGELRMPRL